MLDASGQSVFVYYQAKVNTKVSDLVIVDCYDKNGSQIEGTRFKVGDEGKLLYHGEVRRTKFVLPAQTKFFKFRLPQWQDK